jgi:hypothetical protein
MATDQRVAERFSYTAPLRIRKPAILHGTGADISGGGISILVPKPIAEGIEVELELFGGTVFVTGTVRKVTKGVRGIRVGIQFTEEQPAILAKAMAQR